MSATHRIGTIEVDEERAAADLAAVDPFGYLTAYDEFICGSWRTCMLWNGSGDGADTQICEYDGPARRTEFGARVGYVERLLEATFDLSGLRFARLTRLGPGSVAVPHRDFLELDSDLTRIHIPLETAENCYASEGSTIYRMRLGEVWLLDASRPHSIANFSTGNRTHLLVDFATEPDCAVRPDGSDDGIPTDAIVPRRPLRPDEREAFTRLAEIVDPSNVKDVLSMLIRRYFVAEMEVTDVFRWLSEIATDSGDDDVVDVVRGLEERSLVAR
jgi:L-proline cis-4-hydroxylase